MSETNGIADAISRVETMAQKAMNVTPQIITLPQEKPGTYAVVMPGPGGGKIGERMEIKVAGPLWHNEKIKTPAELVAFIESLKVRGEKAGGFDAKAAVIYIADQHITLHYSHVDRRDRSSVALEHSEPWKFLKGCPVELNQKDLIRVLRITFDGCLRHDSDLIKRVRNIKIDSQGNVSSNLQHGNESINKTILNKVAGQEELPDEFSVAVKVFEGFEQTVNVRVAMELIPEKGRFELIPFPSQLENAERETLTWLRELFKGTGVPAFIGCVRGGDSGKD